MHRFRTALLTAAAIGAGIPAIASAQASDHRSDGEQRGERPDRGQGGQRLDQGQPRQNGDRGERPQVRQQQAPQAQQQAQAAPGQQPAPQAQANQGRPDGRSPDRGRGQRPQDSGQPGQRADPGQRGFAARDDRRPGADGRQGFDRSQAFGQRQDAPRQGFAGNAYRGGDQRFAYDRGRDDHRPDFRAGGPQGRVGADWRGDRRYDWRGYRDQHREVYRIGRYTPPRAYYNYGYRSFDIGFRLDPYFYASNYWIDDPYDYRLPPVWGSYRWVRYYNDVLLVDLETGEVVDVIHSFFW